MKPFSSFAKCHLAVGLGVGLALSVLRADTTVGNTTVTNPNTVIQDPGVVTVNGTINVQSGAGLTIQGGAMVRLVPGFQTTATGSSNFRIVVEAIDVNLGGFGNLLDSDYDGLPDLWEALHFGNLTTATGAGHNDDDGVTNREEYLTGTNPVINENTAVLPTGAQVVVRYPTGSYYKVNSTWELLPTGAGP